MDFTESTKIVYSRIQQVDPENVSKIIGYLLLQDHGERDMIRRAFSPDTLIHSLVHKAKSDLGLMNKQLVPPLSPTLLSQMPHVSEVPLQYPVSPSLAHGPTEMSHWDVHSCYLETKNDRLEFASSANPELLRNFFYPEPALGARSRSPSLPNFPVKTCYYFSKGHCKHGSSCRYFHHGNPPPPPPPATTPEKFNSSRIFSSNNSLDESVSHSIERLEVELVELLKSRRGMPVSIASLPMMYYEKYGRALQAEGYLTESQRHGKAGYSLTKLLARLSNTIRLLDRPHGQHSVILAEDVPKYMEYNDPGGIVPGSRQIYLTFPAESTFTEQDVSSYFSEFGAVRDVRIPCQQKRMFGFVTFVFAETVNRVLGKGNPHFLCGARVLVKPYREKYRPFDRKFSERLMHQTMYYGSNCIDGGDSDLRSCDSNFSLPRVCDNSRLVRKCEPESRSYLGCSMGELKLVEGSSGPADFPSAERLNYLLDVLSIDDDEDIVRNTGSSNRSEQDRYTNY